MKFTTKVLNVKPAKQDPYGALRFPTYSNAAFEFEKAEDIEAAFKGTKPAHVYSRSSNPTVEVFERTMCAATDAFHCIAFSSGMAAVSNTIFALCQAGDNIVCSNKLFGTSFSFFEDTCMHLGIEVIFTDFSKVSEVENAITAQTKLLFFETITNPQIEVFDIPALVAIANKHAIPAVVDCTATPPYMFDAKSFGIHISVLSSTKFISGGATAVGGLLLDYGLYNWANNASVSKYVESYKELAFAKKLRLEVFRNLGACMSSQSASSFLLGLETMELRIDRACSNAQKVAEFLDSHPQVQKVRYPGLKSHINYTESQAYFTYPGSIISFELSSKQECFSVINAVSIIRRSTNLHDNKSLIIHPSSTIYSEYSIDYQKQMDVTESMIRLSVGIENAEDIIADLQQALAVLGNS